MLHGLTWGDFCDRVSSVDVVFVIAGFGCVVTGAADNCTIGEPVGFPFWFALGEDGVDSWPLFLLRGVAG